MDHAACPFVGQAVGIAYRVSIRHHAPEYSRSTAPSARAAEGRPMQPAG